MSSVTQVIKSHFVQLLAESKRLSEEIESITNRLPIANDELTLINLDIAKTKVILEGLRDRN